MFVQVIVGLETSGGPPPRNADGVDPGAEQSPIRRIGKGLTLMRVVTVMFLTVINGHVR
jgi:hypothetical protein